MKLYFDALIGTLLVMLIVGIAAVGLMWLFLSTFHAPQNIIFDGEVLAGIATTIAAVYFFKMTLNTERELSEEL